MPLPNELIVQIYEYSDFEDTFKAFKVFPFLNFMVKEKAKNISDIWNKYAKIGNLEIVKWLHEDRDKECTKHAMDFAAGNGCLEVVKWLHENREEGCTTLAINHAARDGHLEVVKFLHAERDEDKMGNGLCCI